MTRARWLVGGLIGAGALVVAGEALPAYVAGRLVVGVVAVFVLVGVLAVGLVSLARARRYIDGELRALRAEPPGGALYVERRRQFLELRRRGVAPDLDVLADATAAEEAERGYTGKYLVATTVLIGLVGTFGGLMETLARIAPALKGDLSASLLGPAGALGLIAGPLAGLHVTFGTSVVAIMVTLALALIQGDVTLHHERLLAALQERTRHVLLPELWPAEESPAERTVRAVVELRTLVAETLARNAEASAAKVATVVRVEVQKLVEQMSGELRAAAQAQAGALERTSVAMADSLAQSTGAAVKELRDAAATSREAAKATATASREAIDVAAAASREAIDVAAAASREAIEGASGASREAIEAAAEASRETTAATASSLEATARETDARVREETARLAQVVEAVMVGAVTALGELRGSLGAQLEGASQALTTAAGDLRDTVQTLSPALAELGPALGALTTEVALLAARADSPDQPNAVLDELVRLGEDVERLVATRASDVVVGEPSGVVAQEPTA